MLYSLLDTLITKLKEKYVNVNVGFTWDNLKVIKNDEIYVYVDFGNTDIDVNADYSTFVNQDFNIYIVMKSESKVKTIYDNFKFLMDTEIDVIEKMSETFSAGKYIIDRNTTFAFKGLPFNLPLPYFASRIDFVS